MSHFREKLWMDRPTDTDRGQFKIKTTPLEVVDPKKNVRAIFSGKSRSSFWRHFGQYLQIIFLENQADIFLQL